jgi:Cu(I)/Ag(I) efflux system membrane fusion protein
MKRLFLISALLLSVPVAWGGSADLQVEKILTQYFQIHASLANDSTKGIDKPAGLIVQLASDSQALDPGSRQLFADVKAAAERIRGKALKPAREEFFELSKPLFAYLHQDYKGQQHYYRYFCSMAKKGWIQAREGVRNPYYGSEMLTCGELVP